MLSILSCSSWNLPDPIVHQSSWRCKILALTKNGPGQGRKIIICLLLSKSASKQVCKKMSANYGALSIFTWQRAFRKEGFFLNQKKKNGKVKSRRQEVKLHGKNNCFKEVGILKPACLKFQTLTDNLVAN